MITALMGRSFCVLQMPRKMRSALALTTRTKNPARRVSDLAHSAIDHIDGEGTLMGFANEWRGNGGWTMFHDE